jgi:membrane protease YdiL (CAAX protease family)
MARGKAAVDLLVFATFVIGAELAVVIFSLLPTTADPRWRQVAMSGAIGCASLCACILIVFMRGHGAASIGWTGRHFFTNIAIGIGALILLYIACMALVLCIMLIMPELLAGPSTAQQAIEAVFPPMRPAWVVSMMFFVALWEEVAFRGLVLTRTIALLRRWWLAIRSRPSCSAPPLLPGALAVVFTTSSVPSWPACCVASPALCRHHLHWLHDVFSFCSSGHVDHLGSDSPVLCSAPSGGIMSDHAALVE